MVCIQALKNLENSSHITIDIGRNNVSISSLSSLKYTNILPEQCPVLLSNKCRLQTIYINLPDINSLICTLKELLRNKNQEQIEVCVHSNNELFKQLKDNDWNCFKREKHDYSYLIRACSFLLTNVRDEAYTIQDTLKNELKFVNDVRSLYPHILVIINDDVTFIKVTSPENHELLGEPSFSFQTLLKLANSLTDVNDVAETINLAKLYSSTNNETNNGYTSLDEGNKMKSAKIACGLLEMFCSNIGLMSSFYAKMYGISKVIFGETLCDGLLLKKNLASSLENNSVTAMFLRHDNFIFGLGSILSSESLRDLKKSWQENYCESTGMTFQFCFFEGIQTKQLTMDSLDDVQLPCPLLLDQTVYLPDTQNLNTSTSAREYWVECIKEGVEKGMDRMISESSESEVIKGLQLYKDLVLERMDYLNANPQSYGELTMRILQDTMEHMKRETGLITMYEKRKQTENEMALTELPGRLKYLDSLGHDERQEELIISMLAGNMFDWGAREVTTLMKQGKFGFLQAMEKLPVRPWLIDDLDRWVMRTHETPHSLAMVLCDNCGYDLILGIIPFVRELLQRGTKVVICANRDPVINDVTFYDLKNVLEKVKEICPTIKKSLENMSLSTMEIARSTCCTDLSFIDACIAEKMTEVDLFVIEGMGRTVHTNLHAEFNCEALRVAVVKNHWLSRQLGGDMFACICKYTL